jgi:hypothetical protein
MGAVFALFAGWYYWIPKILGLDYNRLLSKVHFWILFIGVIKLAPILAQYKKKLKKILFDTRKSLSIINNRNLNCKKDNYSVNFIYYKLGQFKLKIILFKLFTLIINYLNAQLVEVNNSENKITEIKKASQRLNTKDIQWLVGFTDGDGCLSLYKEIKYKNNWRHEYTIGLQLKDIKLLYKIKKLLGCGVVRKYNNVAIFRIKKIIHLIYVIIPIFDKYPLLTENKRALYLNFRNTLLNKALNSKRNITNKDIIYIKQLLNNKPDNLYKISIENLIINIDYNYFDNWLVGFTEAEGSFYFVKKKNITDNISQIPLRAEFSLSQSNNFCLLTKIKERLKLTREVSLQTNSSNHYYIIAGSILTVQNVINFYTNPNIVKLKGIKYFKFILWLKGIKNIIRYKKIKIPINYGGDSS